jgi:DNA polymerase I-like protein with 3'-5' exonuclease and polymerase domains
MSIPKVIAVDFETKGILPRPKYPPKPVSIGIKWPGEPCKLMAWGHGDGSKAAGNNCTEKEARGELKKAYTSKYALLMQNAAFDLDVAETHWELAVPEWRKTHDTMFLIFLDNPHAESLGLKQSAERLLSLKPEERDAVNEWIIANVPEAKRKPSSAGAYICRCPFKIVAPYLKGDLDRTLKLFEFLYPRIVDAGMLEAYQRELRLMPVLLRSSRRGMRIDIAALERDTPKMRAGVEAADAWLRKRLGDINLNSPMQLGQALLSKGVVTEFKRTEHGQLSTSKKHLTLDRFKDPKVYQALTYRNQMETAVGTFMESWLELADDGDSLFPDWSQVRASKGGGNDSKGAKSGRIICQKPNLLNLPKRWIKAVVAGYVHPTFIKGAPELPFIRTYALPHKGKRWGHRDFKMQELVLFAYFEDGPVQEAFVADPDYDIHETVRIEEERQLIDAGLRDSFDRDSAKNTVFARMYGQGVTGLLETLKLSEDERPVAQIVQRAINTALPSVKDIDNQLKALLNSGRPLRTIGGRLYYVEEPKYIARFNRVMDFAYRGLSMLCQGSGADFTKEAICLYEEHPKRTEDLLVSVYDEINTDLPMSDKGAKQEMKVLGECMSAAFDINPLKMRSDGKIGPNWGSLVKFNG